MKFIGLINTSVLLLLLGTVAPGYSLAPQHQQNGKPPVWIKKRPAKGHQQPPPQAHRPPRHEERGPGAERRAVWHEHRAQRWQSEHRNWQERGGYDGYRISRSQYRSQFGPRHAFRIHRYPVGMVGGFINFQFGGFGFSVVDPLPEYWSENWYDNDDVYISGSRDGYYLHNRRHPQDRIAIRVNIR